MNTTTNRIEVAGQGVGEVGNDLIAARAQELAHIDGRNIAHEGDLAAAKAELQGEHLEAPEESVATSQLTEWDEAPSELGTQAPRVPLENEENMGEALFTEGLDEADHDRRVQASQSDS